MGDRYVKQDENKKILYVDSINLYGHSMSQRLLRLKVIMKTKKK